MIQVFGSQKIKKRIFNVRGRAVSLLIVTSNNCLQSENSSKHCMKCSVYVHSFKKLGGKWLSEG